jgi:hypothetical protein
MPFEDGQKEYDDRGFVCYYDAETQDWVCAEEFATQRFLDVLKNHPDFEGFDDGANDDTDVEDSEDELVCDDPYCKERSILVCDDCKIFACNNHERLCRCGKAKLIKECQEESEDEE